MNYLNAVLNGTKKQNTFFDCVDKDATRQLGPNLHPELTREGLDDDLLALSFRMIRGLSETIILDHVRKIVKNARKNNDINLIIDLFILGFVTRSHTIGKCEKLVVYMLFNILSVEYPKVVQNCITLLPTNGGYYKDGLLFLEVLKRDIEKHKIEERIKFYNDTFHIIALEFSSQLSKDYETLLELKENPTCNKSVSLCAKWTPRVGKNSHFNDKIKVDNKKNNSKKIGIGSAIAYYSFNDNPKKSESLYRKRIKELCDNIIITERQMCSNDWDSVTFEGKGKVMSTCCRRNKRAFLNELKKPPVPDTTEFETGNRHPEDESRIKLRKRFLESCKQGKISGKSVSLPDLGKDAMHCPSITDKMVINAQYDSYIKGLRTRIKEKTGKEGFLNALVMSDVSGSMVGRPMHHSVSIGIAISDLIEDVNFRHRVLTFSSNPQWHKLSDKMSFTDKVSSLLKADWGGSTNLHRAMKLIIDIIKIHKIAEPQIPTTLVILSDMAFDSATNMSVNQWNVAYEEIKKDWEKMGNHVYGHPIKPPQIVFWNLNCTTAGFPAASDQVGVSLLSGEGTAQLLYVVENISPAETLRRQLDDPSWEHIRTILKEEYTTELSYGFS